MSGVRNARHDNLEATDGVGELARGRQPRRAPHHQPARGPRHGQQGEHHRRLGNLGEEAGTETETGKEKEKK